MATLDKIIDLQGKGLSDEQISTQLTQEGISPKEIQDSLGQARIKSAVSPLEDLRGKEQSPPDMQESIMQAPLDVPPAPQNQNPLTPNAPIQGKPPLPQGQGEPQPPIQEYPQAQGEFPPQGEFPQEYYPETPQGYSGQEYYPEQGAIDTETITEIAEQAVSEKLESFKKNLDETSSFKKLTQEKVSNIDNRLKRIEDTIDKLQQAIIGKLGEYGESSKLIHKDLDNLHGTVSKLMNPLVDNYKELKKIADKT